MGMGMGMGVGTVLCCVVFAFACPCLSFPVVYFHSDSSLVGWLVGEQASGRTSGRW